MLICRAYHPVLIFFITVLMSGEPRYDSFRCVSLWPQRDLIPSFLARAAAWCVCLCIIIVLWVSKLALLRQASVAFRSHVESSMLDRE